MIYPCTVSQKSVYSNQLFSKQVLSESISILVISFVRNSSLSEVSFSCLQLGRNRVRGIRSVLVSSAAALKLAVFWTLDESPAENHTTLAPNGLYFIFTESVSRTVFCAVLDRLYETEALCSLDFTVNPQMNNCTFGCLWVQYHIS